MDLQQRIMSLVRGYVWVINRVIAVVDSSLVHITREPRMIYGSLVWCADPSRCFSDVAQFSCSILLLLGVFLG